MTASQRHWMEAIGAAIRSATESMDIPKARNRSKQSPEIKKILKLLTHLQNAKFSPDSSDLRNKYQIARISRSKRHERNSFANLATVIGIAITTFSGQHLERSAREMRQHITSVNLDFNYLQLDVILRPYQKFGAQFIAERPGVILGDEMGLGKTIQTLAAIGHLQTQGCTHFLVFCPLGLIENWMNEIKSKTFLSGIRVYGPNWEYEFARWISQGGVAITNFDSARKIYPQRFAASGQTLAMVVVDEAHFIKNLDAQRSIATGNWLAMAERKVLLTGTPIKSSRRDFENLISYVSPSVGMLTRYAHSERGFARLISGIYLRRKQRDVLAEIPESIEIDDVVSMTPGDEARYRRAADAKNFMRMRYAASITGPDGSAAKIERLLEILEEAKRENRKVIVFSYFREVLTSIKSVAGDALVGPISGSTPAAERQKIVSNFNKNKDPAVLVMQIGTGGYGFNIQAATVVVLMEPQYNPSDEDQAIARARRMGQRERVIVRRIITSTGVDDGVRQILAYKRSLHEGFSDNDPSVHFRVERIEKDLLESERRRLGLY